MVFNLFGLKLNAQWKIIGLILAIFFIVLLLIFILIFYVYRNFILEGYLYGAEMRASSLSVEIHNHLELRLKSFEWIAEHNSVLLQAVEQSNARHDQEGDEAALSNILRLDKEWVEGQPGEVFKQALDCPAADVLKDFIAQTDLPIVEFFATDRLGAVVASTVKTEDYYQGDEGWWQDVFYSAKSAVNLPEIRFDKNTGVFGFFVVLPLLGDQQEVLGVLKAHVDKDVFLKRIMADSIAQGGEVGVIRSDGFILKRFNEIEGLGNGQLSSWWISQLDNFIPGKVSLTTIPGLSKKTILGKKRIEPCWPTGLGDVYVYTLDLPGAFYKVINSFFEKLFLLWAFATLCLVLAGLCIKKEFIRPLNVLMGSLARLGRGDLNTQVLFNSGDEWDSVAESFNRAVELMRDKTVSKDYFNDIIQNMSDILFVIDSFGKINVVNKRAAEILGYSVQEMIHQEAAIFFSKSDRYLLSWGLKGLIEEGALKDKTVKLITKKGVEVEVFLGVRSLKDHEGNLIGLICLAKDLSDVKQLLDSLQKSNQEILRHKEELEKSLKDLTESRDVMLSVLEDTTESKERLEQALMKLKATQDELLQAEKMSSLGQIAAGVAHEINNPLFVISGEAEILGMSENQDPTMKESVKVIGEQVKRIDDIIQRLLEFSRKKDAKFVRLEVQGIVQKSIDLLSYQIKALGHIEIAREFSEKTFYVLGDQTQMQEIFLNIMLNAAQAMDAKGGRLTIRIFSEIIEKHSRRLENKFRLGQNIVCIEIEDTGPGITEDSRKKIFDPFFTTKKTGTGLGLSMCAGIIERHNGMIEVKSVLGEGAKFSIRFPLA